MDLKLVEVAVVSTDEDGNDVIGDYEALIQIVGHGFFGAPLPVDDQNVPLFRAHSSFEHREVEQELVDFDGSNQPSPRFETIVKSLHPFIGNRILLRFRFDTVDDFANDALGWFIDDITVEGSGFKGQQTAVTPLEPPLTVNNVTWYGTFDTTFTLAEGLNRVVAAAEQPYPPKPHGPNLSGVDSVNGYLDLTGPAVTLGGIDDIVAVPSQTLQGTIDDINFTSMAITQTYLAGNGVQEKTVYAITELPGDGTFSAPVSLLEGTNTFKATALDGSLNESEVTFAVGLDTVAPALSPLSTSYPVGAASARGGDLVVFQASSTDALGVDRVSLTLPDGSVKDMVPSAQVPEAVLDQWRTAAPWVLPMEVPSATPPGAFELTVTAVDNAGNQASASVVANVVPALEGVHLQPLARTEPHLAPVEAGHYYDHGPSGRGAPLRRRHDHVLRRLFDQPPTGGPVVDVLARCAQQPPDSDRATDRPQILGPDEGRRILVLRSAGAGPAFNAQAHPVHVFRPVPGARDRAADLPGRPRLEPDRLPLGAPSAGDNRAPEPRVAATYLGVAVPV